MSVSPNVAAIELGGSNINGAVGSVELDTHGRPFVVWHTERKNLPTTKGPNDPDEDLRRMCTIIDKLEEECAKTGLTFDDVVVSTACQIDENGEMQPSGNLSPHAGRNLGQLLKARYPDKRFLVESDGAMFVAAEIVGGVMDKQGPYWGRSGLLFAPGTGIAVCGFEYDPVTDMYTLHPGEGAHMVVDIAHKPLPREERCGCGNYCVETAGSGRALEQYAIAHGFVDSQGQPDVGQIDPKVVVDILAPPLATMVANATRLRPRQMKLVVVSGTIPHKQDTLTDRIAEETHAQCNGFVKTPKFVRSEFPDGLRGPVAYWYMFDQDMLRL